MATPNKKLEQIYQYRSTRNNEIDNRFLLGIILNYNQSIYTRISFIHKILKEYKINNLPVDKNLKLASGLFICSLITCWETFFREIFIFICNIDTEISTRLSTQAPNEIPLGLTIGEYEARKYNFQNLTSTKDAFNNIFELNNNDFSDYFTDDIFNGTVVTSLPIILVWLQAGTFKRNIEDTLISAFNIRHQSTHDANYLAEYESKLFSEIESVFQATPQFFAAHFAKKYSQEMIVMNMSESFVRVTDTPNGDEKAYVFSIEDMLATDYKILE